MLKKEFTGQEILDFYGQEITERVLSQTSMDRNRLLNEYKWTEFAELINISLTWSLTTEGAEYWKEIYERKDTPDFLDYEGQRLHVSGFEVVSEKDESCPNEIKLVDSIRKCEITQEYFMPYNTATLFGITGNCRGWVHKSTASDDDYNYSYVLGGFIRCEDSAYGYVSRRDEDYLPLHDCVMSHRDDIYFLNRDVAESKGYYYRDYHDDYIHEDDDDFDEGEDDGYSGDAGDYNAGYHNLNRRWKTSKDTKFTVGFEIEKEDRVVACKHHYQDLYNRTEWCKERDGSLDDGSGYELVSPVLNLFSNQLEIELKDEVIRELVNADYNTSTCGGHINLGSSEYTPEQLFEGMSAFYPLLYAMYPYRISKSYSKAKKKHEYYQKEKYSAIYMRDNVLEFRIFSGVKNVEQLIWRRDLIRIFCDNINKSEADVLRMLIDHRSKLYKHLRKVYSQEILIDKTELFINHVREWNNKKLPQVNRNQIKKDNLDNNQADKAA